MTNAFKHAKATKVRFTVEKDGGNVALTLRDNGIGISEDQVRQSTSGIYNMFQRARRINSNLQIHREEGWLVIRLEVNLTL
ncbi:Nitrate/nitrite sensor protein NarX [compost metagenome]